MGAINTTINDPGVVIPKLPVSIIPKPPKIPTGAIDVTTDPLGYGAGVTAPVVKLPPVTFPNFSDTNPGTTVYNNTANMTGDQLLKNTKLANMAMDYAVARGISPNASWLWNISGDVSDKTSTDTYSAINYVQSENGWKQYAVDGSYESPEGIKYSYDELQTVVDQENAAYTAQQAKADAINAMSPTEQAAAFKENFPELNVMPNAPTQDVGLWTAAGNLPNSVSASDIPYILAGYLDTRKAYIADLNALAGKVAPDDAQIDAFVTAALADMPKFLDTIRAAGRNANTEALLKAASPGITEDEIRNAFGQAQILTKEQYLSGFPSRTDKDYQTYVSMMNDTSVWSTLTKIRDAGIGNLLAGLSQGAKWAAAKLNTKTDLGNGRQLAEPAGKTLGFDRLLNGLANNLAEDSWYWQPGQILDQPPTAWADHWANAWNWRAWGTNIGPQAPTLFTATVFTLWTYGQAAPAFGAVATEAGLGPFASAVVSNVGGSQLPIWLGASQTAASTYDQGLTKWGDPTKAMKAANAVYNQSILSGEITIPLQMAVAFAPVKAPLTTLNNGVAKGLFAARVVGGRMVIDSLTNAGQALYMDIRTRQALGQEVKLDDEMKMTLIMAVAQGSAFSAYGSMEALGNSFKTRIYDSLPAETQAVYIQAHEDATLSGVDEKSAAIKAWDTVAQTPDGLKVIKAVSAMGKVEGYEAELLPKIVDDVQKTALETSLNRQKEAIIASSGVDVAGKVTTKAESTATMTTDEARMVKIPSGNPAYQALLSDEMSVADLNSRLDFYQKQKQGWVDKAATDKGTDILGQKNADYANEQAAVYDKTIAGIETLLDSQPVIKGEGPGTPSWSEFFKTPEASHDWIKKELTNYIRRHVPMEERGKLLIQVRDAKTMEDLDFAINKANNLVETYQQKTLKASILKEIGKINPKKDATGVVTGKFTAEVQRQLDSIKAGLKMDRSEARQKMLGNNAAFDAGKLGYDEMRAANAELEIAGLDGMTAAEMANTLDVIKSIKQYGRAAKAEAIAVDKAIIDAVKTEVATVLTGGKGIKPGSESVPAASLEASRGKVGAFLEKRVNENLNFGNQLDKLSKFDKNSKPNESALSKFGQDRVTAGRNAESKGLRDWQHEVQTKVMEIFGIKKNAEFNRMLTKLKDEPVNLGIFKNSDGVEIDLNSKKIAGRESITKGKLIKKYQELQDPTLEKTFTDGMKWTQEIKDAVINSLTPQEKAYADWQMQFYRDYYGTINDVYSKLYGVDLGHNPNYSPVTREREIAGRTAQADTPEVSLMGQEANRYASTKNGSLISRVDNSNPLKFVDATDALMNHIVQMEHFKAWANPMKDLRRVFGDTTIRTAIRQYHGSGVMKIMDDYLNIMARGGVERAKVNKNLDFLRKNFTTAVLGLKPLQLLKQPPAVIGYLTEMPTGDFISGMADFWTNPKAHTEYLMKNSEGLRDRYTQGAWDRDVHFIESSSTARTVSGTQDIRSSLMWMMEAGDKIGTVQGMWAKYKSGLKRGLSDAEAILEAERSTGRTQNSSYLDTLSPLQNGGSLAKLVTMFQNQPAQYFRMIDNNMRNFQYGRGSRVTATKNIMIAMIVAPALFQLVADGFKFKKENQLKAWALGPINDMLVIGTVAQSVVGRMTGETFNYQASPVLQTFDDASTMITKAVNLVKNGNDPYKGISMDDVISFVEYMGKTGGEALGYPTPYIIQAEQAIRAGKPLQFLFSAYALKDAPTDASKTNDSVAKLGKPGMTASEMAKRDSDIENGVTTGPFKLGNMSGLYSDFNTIYDHVLPSTLSKDKSVYVQSYATEKTAEDATNILPYKSLKDINTDVIKGRTIIDYYKLWQARSQITNLVDLEKFDQLNGKESFLGNVDRPTYELLVQYMNAKDKPAFLKDHPELSSNPRDTYLIAHPSENAQLALWGQADVLTQAAYNQLQTLLSTLDIPTSAISNKIPTPLVSKSYFTWLDASAKYGTSSPEAKLARMSDANLEKWGETNLNWAPLKDSLESMQIQVKYASNYDAYAALDTTAKKNDYLAKNPVFRDQMFIATGLDYTDKSGNHMSHALALKYAAYRKASSPTAYRRANSDLNTWMVNAGHWTALS